MRKLVIVIVALGTLSVSADAGLVCATPPEMKVLQSTALQQQLMVAALTCRMREDYNRFVTAYRDGLVQSDQALKAFFAARPRGEDYNAYKTRVANQASLRSTHDPRFCDSARKVFDMALGRRLERRGLAPEPPQLVDTGYEGCRAVDDTKLIEAKARPAAKVALAPKPVPRPANAPVKLAAAHSVSLQMAKPVPTPKPVVTAEAVRALALRPHIAATVPKPVPVVTVQSKPVQVAVAGPKPAGAAKPVSATKSEPNLTALKPSSRIASGQPPQGVSPAIVPAAPLERQYWRDVDRDGLAADEDPSNSTAAEPEPEHSADADDPYADNPIPNAYRPGAEWVSDSDPVWRAPPPVRHPVGYDRPPPRRPHAVWVLTADGRWVLVVRRTPRWVRY
jgi:hypothetical protein